MCRAFVRRAYESRVVNELCEGDSVRALKLSCWPSAGYWLVSFVNGTATRPRQPSAHIRNTGTLWPAASIGAICDPDDRIQCEQQVLRTSGTKETCACASVL